MILIPSTGREEPETEKMSELDKEMSRVLKNTSLSIKEKVEKVNFLHYFFIFKIKLVECFTKPRKTHCISNHVNIKP